MKIRKNLFWSSTLSTSTVWTMPWSAQLRRHPLGRVAVPFPAIVLVLTPRSFIWPCLTFHPSHLSPEAPDELSGAFPAA